ncbi:helix-turn-helix domain-containing protein [Lacticaseibacillus sharpeae]|nr:helix-turn-helix transcriptional regulator [Lacticaseibacillus sharpeae]
MKYLKKLDLPWVRCYNCEHEGRRLKIENRLKQVRNTFGWTLDDLAARSGIKRGTLNNYENGKTEPKMATWQKLADVFNVPVSYLQGLPITGDLHDLELAKELVKRLRQIVETDDPDEIRRLARKALKELRNDETQHPR